MDRRPFLSLILGLLLVSTTPVGTGGGVHQFDLVHPLFTHVHLYAGRVLTHEQLEQAIAAPHASVTLPLGPAFAAGSASPGGDAGLAFSPTLPPEVPGGLMNSAARTLEIQVARPGGRVEAPPDPPPTASSA